MTSTTPPTETPTQPPTQPGYSPYAPVRDGRPVSFYVAIFLSLLLLVSGALNLLLLVVSAFGSATTGLGSGAVVEEDGTLYQLVAVAGNQNAEHSILRIPIVGAIAEEGNPMIGAAGGTVSQVRRALAAAERESSIKGVLLDINSPGGGATDSDLIWQLIVDFKKDNPDIKIVALLGDTAASGGYYIAVACDRIMARATTITGSIGVIISTYNVSEALEKIGVEPVNIVSKDTPYKDMMSPTRPMRPDEVAKVRAIVQEMYDRFVDIVNEGRPQLTRNEVVERATGEIYSAKQAEELGLVDSIGTLNDAYAKLRELNSLEETKVVEHRRVPTLFDSLFQVRQPGFSVDHVLAGLLRSSTGPRFLYYWPGGR